MEEGLQASSRRHTAAHVQRDVRGAPRHRLRVPDGLPEGPAPRAVPRRLDRPGDARRRRRGHPPLVRPGHPDRRGAAHQPAGLQGGRDARGARGARLRVHRDLRRRLPARARLPAARDAVLPGQERRLRAGEVDLPQPGRESLLPLPGDLPQRAHQVRAVRALRDGQLLQLQRHRRRLAQGVHLRRRRLERAHARRGHGPLSARLPARLAVCVGVRHDLPERDPVRLQGVPQAAAALVVRADAAVGGGAALRERVDAAAAAQELPEHLLLRRAHARDQRHLVHLLLGARAADAARVRAGGGERGDAPPLHAVVGDRVAAAARHHVDDGLLAKLVPLHDPLRHVRERNVDPQAGRVARGPARPQGRDDVDGHAEARRRAGLRPDGDAQEDGGLRQGARRRPRARRRRHLRLQRRHVVGLHRLLLHAGLHLPDLLALARRGLQPAAAVGGEAARAGGGARGGRRRRRRRAAAAGAAAVAQ